MTDCITFLTIAFDKNVNQMRDVILLLQLIPFLVKLVLYYMLVGSK